MKKETTDVNSFTVYSKIYPGRLSILWTFGLIAGPLFCLFWWIDERQPIATLYIGISLAVIVVGAHAWTWLTKVVTYRKYKTFRDDAGFKVVGWENLLRNPDLLKPQHWAVNSSVEVIVKPGATEADRKIIADALFLFTKQANMRYYKGRYGSGRVEWKDESWTKATGSIDVAVAGDIYTLIQKYLTGIQRSRSCIEQVNVNIDERVNYVTFQKGGR